MNSRIGNQQRGTVSWQEQWPIPRPAPGRQALVAFFASLAITGLAAGQPAGFTPDDSPPRPQPNWVELVDLSNQPAKLPGSTVLAGLSVREAARSPLLDGVVALTVDAHGNIYSLSSNIRIFERPGEAERPASASPDAPPRGRIVHWQDRDGDGVWESPQVLMDDLEAPQGLLVHEGWFYWLSRGRLLRRRPYEHSLAQSLASAAQAGQGPPTSRTPDSRWLEQELVRGLGPQLEQACGGLSLTPRGWLYVSVGSGQHQVRSWDGTTAVVPASGAVLRLRPDGSRLELWARGLVAPTAVTWDSLGNGFLADAGISPPFLSRLIQLWEGADYGWRQVRTASQEPVAELRPDPLRAGDPAQRPGCLPPLLVWRPMRPTAALLWLGDGLDERLRGQLLIADVAQGAVHVFGLAPHTTGTRVAWQFPLFSVKPSGLVPTALLEGPDGALYVAARPASAPPNGAARPAEGCIWRLAAAEAAAPSAAPPANRFQALATASDDELLGILETTEGAWPLMALQTLLARAKADDATRQRLLLQIAAQALNTTRPPKARAMALAGLGQLDGSLAMPTLLGLVADDDPEMAQLAAEAVADLPLATHARSPEGLPEAIEAVEAVLGRTTHPRVERALRLALGRLAATGGGLEAAEWNFESMSVTDRPRTPRIVFDAHVRALEMVPGAARELLLGNLDVAINFPQAEERERQRIKEFVVRTAEAMRTTELAAFLDALFSAEDDLAGKLEPQLAARLIACYRHVETQPPAPADAVAAWLQRHPQAPVAVQATALETLVLVGTSQPSALERLIERQLAGQPALAVLLAQRWLQGQTADALKPVVLKALARQAAADPRGPAARLIEELQRTAP